MKKPPYYKWCPAEHPETDSMTPELRGCYRSLIDHSWENGFIPKDFTAMAVICGFFPVEQFQKAVWSVIKDHFSPAPDGGYCYPGFYEQIKKSKKLSKLQSERAKSMWQKRKDSMPKAYQTYTEPMPERPNKQIIVKLPEPAASLRHTGIMPESSGLKPDDIPHEPLAYRNDAELEPELNHLTPIVKFDSEPDQYFEPLAAWEKFASAWPQENLINDAESKEWFWREIISVTLYKRLVRAAERYLGGLAPGWNPMSFIIWTAQWTAWEDPDPVKK